jgi:hypothetical protein
MRGASNTFFTLVLLEGASNKGGAFNMGGASNRGRGLFLVSDIFEIKLSGTRSPS